MNKPVKSLTEQVVRQFVRDGCGKFVFRVGEAGKTQAHYDAAAIGERALAPPRQFEAAGADRHSFEVDGRAVGEAQLHCAG